MKKKPGSKTFEFVSHSPEDTKKFGGQLASIIKIGDVILLLAGLGCGKTTLVQGVAKQMGSKDRALSPTFVLVRTLDGRIPLHHLDFYRLKKNEVPAIGIQDYLLGEGEIEPGALFIEWADRCPEVWPSHRLEVRMSIQKKNQWRKIRVRGLGKRYEEIVEKLKKFHEK